MFITFNLFYIVTQFKLIKSNKIMKPIKLLALGAILVMTATSCDTYKHSYRLTDVPTSNIAVTNQVVDVKADFNNKVKASSDRINTSIADAKNNAYFNAIIENDIDVLVDPIYSVRVRRGLFKTTAKATVHGFAGEYINPRSTAAAKEETFKTTLEAFEDFLDLKEVVNEEKTTTIINSCCGEGGKSGSTSHTIDSSPALIDQFNSLYGNSSSPDVKVGGGSTSDENATFKKKGLLSKIPLIGRFF